MHFVILGSGAVGGYYGAKLVHAGHRVSFLARGAHLRAMRDHGLEVRSPLGGDRDPEGAGEVVRGLREAKLGPPPASP